MPSSEYCYYHAPELEARRRTNNRKGGRRGGKGRPVTEIREVKDKLRELADDVLAGDVDKAVGAVVSQILNTYVAAARAELKVVEQAELTQRVEELEQLLARKERHYA